MKKRITTTKTKEPPNKDPHTHTTCAHTSVTVQIQPRYPQFRCPITRRFWTCKVHVERRKCQAMLTLQVFTELPSMHAKCIVESRRHSRCASLQCDTLHGCFWYFLQMPCNFVVQRAKISRITLTSPGPPLDCVLKVRRERRLGQSA